MVTVAGENRDLLEEVLLEPNWEGWEGFGRQQFWARAFRAEEQLRQKARWLESWNRRQ